MWKCAHIMALGEKRIKNRVVAGRHPAGVKLSKLNSTEAFYKNWREWKLFSLFINYFTLLCSLCCLDGTKVTTGRRQLKYAVTGVNTICKVCLENKIVILLIYYITNYITSIIVIVVTYLYSCKLPKHSTRRRAVVSPWRKRTITINNHAKSRAY